MPEAITAEMLAAEPPGHHDDVVAQPFALDPAASKLVQDLCYTPAQGDDPTETIPHNITFTDHASASGTGVLSKDTVASSETSVTCPLGTDPDSVHP